VTAKKIGYSIFLIIGILGIFDTLFLLTYNIVNTGTFIPGVMGIIFVVGAYLKLKRNVVFIKSFKLKCIAAVVICLITVSFIIIESLICISAKSDETSKVEYVILLGAGLNGEQITATFKYRIDMCYDYLVKNPSIKVIVTGGRGIGESISEAEAMKKYLVARGVSENRITMEDRATSTYENFKYSKELIDKEDTENKRPSVMIITSDFHMFRSKILAKKVGFEPKGISAKTWSGVLINCCIREYIAIIKMIVLNK
jgi:uncharacterized SAM-binding protein YcdF (DUF218 family)